VISGDILREARLRAGLTQKQLATRAKTSQSAVARWESGDVVPSFERLRELVRACGLELTYGLANYDDSYDYFIDKRLELEPEGRVRQSLKEEAVYDEIRAAAGVSRVF
jgi:transcriptional regulator with XRE-family HTH domain